MTHTLLEAGHRFGGGPSVTEAEPARRGGVPAPRHVVSLADWSSGDYQRIFELAGRIHNSSRGELAELAPGILLGSLFFQNSTRTRISFDAAAHRIGGSSVGFSDVSTTRAGDFYQESLEDTVRVVGSYVDALVIRHTEDDAAVRAAAVSGVPVISAGTGNQEHPTQVLLDTWMMSLKLGGLRGRTIGYMGDPTCRVARSLVYALAALGAAGLVFLMPDDAAVPKDVEADLHARGLTWEYASSAEELLSMAEAVCVIPFELSDFHQSAVRSYTRADALDERFVLTRELLSGTGADVVVTHTGPRGPELPVGAEEAGSVCYFEAVARGVSLRAALLVDLLADATAR